MPRYVFAVTVISHRDNDDEARQREQRIVELLRSVFVDARVSVTTLAEKPLPTRFH
jgi:hypothetical protein